jgi:hypothetical protein
MKKSIVLCLCLVISFYSFSQRRSYTRKSNSSSEQNNEKNDGEKQKDSKPVWNNITFLNAANFDFTDNITGTYLAKLNIFSPDIKGSPFGFNAGILRSKFQYKDSSNSIYNFDNKLIHPLDSIKTGTKFLRQYNKYTTTRANTVWSFYVQPMLRIVSWPERKDRKWEPNSILPNGIYFHIHGELLVSKVNVTTNIETLQQDTSIIDASKDIRYITYQPNPLIFDRTYLNGYFGAGLTFNLDPFNNGNSRFLFQFTFGGTTDYPNWANRDISSSTLTILQTRGGTVLVSPGSDKKKWFYLVRSEFAQMLSNNAELIVGFDTRGLGKYNPLYSTYIGLNVNLDALAKIISDKGKDDKNVKSSSD